MATITVNSDSKLQEFFDLCDVMEEENRNGQLTPDWKQKHSLAFAKVGIFNPITLADFKDLIHIPAANGNCPRNRDMWFLDQWGRNPIRLNRCKLRSEKKTKAKWEYTIEQSKLYLTPHSLARYRERTGTFVNPDTQCWNIPHIPDAIVINKDTVLTNILLPTLGGAWLGYDTIMRGGYVEHYKYDRKRGLRISQNSDIVRHFYACSFISTDMMSSEQLDIVDAYNQKQFKIYQNLVIDYSKKHPNSIFDTQPI